jgi:predicted DNA-binding transcriptional regulator YafY
MLASQAAMKKDTESSRKCGAARKRSAKEDAPVCPDATLNRPTLARIQIIHTALQSRKYVTNAALRKQLDVCRQTISQDIRLMQDRLGIAVEYDQKRHAYFLADEESGSALIQLPVKELIAMVIARGALGATGNMDLVGRVSDAIERISNHCGPDVLVHLEELEDVFSFQQKNARPQIDQALLDAVTVAVQSSHEIEFIYKKPRGEAPEQRRVRPLHLTFQETWYLFAEDPARNGEIRLFMLSRMHEVRDTLRVFEKLAKFDPTEKLAHSIGVYGGDPEPVRIRLTPLAAQIVTERPWHKTQQLLTLANGSLEFALCVAINPEFEQRVLAWGSQMEVLKPLSLRRSVLEHAREIVARG